MAPGREDRFAEHVAFARTAIALCRSHREAAETVVRAREAADMDRRRWWVVLGRRFVTYAALAIMGVGVWHAVTATQRLANLVHSALDLDLERKRMVMHLDIERCRQRGGFPVFRFWSGDLERCDPLPEQR